MNVTFKLTGATARVCRWLQQRTYGGRFREYEAENVPTSADNFEEWCAVNAIETRVPVRPPLAPLTAQCVDCGKQTDGCKICNACMEMRRY